MTYNFDEIIDRRHTNALNTDGFRGYIFHAGPEKVFAFKDEEFVRMWVADMEFGVAPEILDALRARIDRRIFGYTGLYDDNYYHTFSKWCKDHYDWHFPKEQLCISPGIIPALYQLTEMLYHGHPIHKWHNKGSVHQDAFYHPYAMPLQIAVILPKLSQLPSAFCIQRFFYNHSVPHNDSTQRILFSPFR